MGMTTSWPLVLASAADEPGARERFTRRYVPVMRAYLQKRWHGARLAAEVDDAVQEVFLELFRSALGRVDQTRQVSFRAYLYGVVRHVAQRHERTTHGRRVLSGDSQMEWAQADEPTLSAAFDREWARGVLRHALQALADEAAAEGPEAERRVELLRLRFQEGKPIRDIAVAWGEDPTHLHRQFTRVRRAFRRIILDQLGLQSGADGTEVEREIRNLRNLLRPD